MFKIKPLIVIILIFLVLLFLTGAVSPLGFFNLVLLQPILNFLMLLARILFGSLGLAIIALTIIIMIFMMPLTMKQMRSSRAMQEIQPRMKELQKKYGKDKQRLQEETWKVYKESGVSPAGCGFTMLIQMPIWFALYRAVIQAAAISPEYLFGLSKQLYSWSAIQGMVPLDSHFLWLDLSRGDPIMAVLTGGSMWVLQSMSQPSDDEPSQQQSMNNMMRWMMPLMFGFFALTLPSGLAVYWVGANIMRIILQYRTTGWGSLKVPSLGKVFPKRADVPAGTGGTSGRGKSSNAVGETFQQEGAEVDGVALEQKEAGRGDITSQRRKVRHGKHRDKRKVRGRGRRPRSS